MTDLKIPNYNKNSEKYLFKNKLTTRRKSRRKLFRESCFMFSVSLLLIYLNYLIPEKIIIFNNFFSNIKNIIVGVYGLITYVYEIFVVIFILVSMVISIILIFGSFYRLFKISKGSTRQISLK